MKGVKVFTLIVFFAIIAVPLALFNFKPGAVSDIDNRKLAENPFGSGADKSVNLQKRIDNYVNDRIGLREEMIQGYTILNDLLFHKMVHPSYIYGKDGYIFGAGITTKNDFGEYHIVLADMIKKIQDYCTQRKVSFVLMFDPSKPSILTDKLPSSVNYDRGAVEQFLKELDKRGVNYVDNTTYLKQINDSGIAVFNKKYDANHWNDDGAFYGTQNVLKKLKETNPSVHINEQSEFNISTDTAKYLSLSRFPINETVPKYTAKLGTSDLYRDYSDLTLDKNYHSFSYTVNKTRKNEGCPKALIFQGSYMYTYGHKFFESSFSECIQVHNYQNVINFPYYYNLFKPQVVVFELADFTMTNSYFNMDKMKQAIYNLTYKSVEKSPKEERSLPYDGIEIKKHDKLTDITWHTDEEFDCVWLAMDNKYDMVKTADGYTVTVYTSEKEKFDGKLRFIGYKDKTLYNYT